MKIHFRNILFGNFNIVINKLETFLSFFIPQTAFPTQSKRSKEHNINMKGYTHTVQESDHFLINQHIVKHGDEKIFKLVLIFCYSILIFVYISLEFAKIWPLGLLYILIGTDYFLIRSAYVRFFKLKGSSDYSNMSYTR